MSVGQRGKGSGETPRMGSSWKTEKVAGRVDGLDRRGRSRVPSGIGSDGRTVLGHGPSAFLRDPQGVQKRTES